MEPLSAIQGGMKEVLERIQEDFRSGSVGDRITEAPLGREGSGKNSIEFGKMLKDGLEEVSQLQRESRAKMEGFLTGRTRYVHEVLTAMEKSGLAFQMMLEIRTRLMSAWKEITRISV